MKCGHCGTSGAFVSVQHVKACSGYEQMRQTLIKTPREQMVAVAKTFADTAAAAMPLSTWAETEADISGVYCLNGVYYKVQKSGTGNWYAKVLESQWADGIVEWTYQGRKPLYRLTLNDKVSAEQAAQFGQLTGTCVFCSRMLTDERSIFVGYGPTCAEKNSLPWGEVPEPDAEDLADARIAEAEWNR